MKRVQKAIWASKSYNGPYNLVSLVRYGFYSVAPFDKTGFGKAFSRLTVCKKRSKARGSRFRTSPKMALLLMCLCGSVNNVISEIRLGGP